MQAGVTLALVSTHITKHTYLKNIGASSTLDYTLTRETVRPIALTLHCRGECSPGPRAALLHGLCPASVKYAGLCGCLCWRQRALDWVAEGLREEKRQINLSNPPSQHKRDRFLHNEVFPSSVQHPFPSFSLCSIVVHNN